ncbi:MAG: FlgD immunoglobulin-like domain containing protein [Candidatus Zixiibacteriota bacterium]
MKRFSMIAGIITLVLFVSVLVGVSDVVSAQGQRGDHHGKGFWANLTEEQREAVRVKTKEMRSQDATREEIRTAVAELLQGYGIELPEKCRLLGGSEGLRHNRGGFMANLTDEQRGALREKVKDMRSQGATREEIRAAKAEMLKGCGIELPDNRGERRGFGHGRGGFVADLTDEQRQALREKIKEMQSQDATREEIRAAKAEMLKGYGIELPDNRGERRGFGHGRGGFGADLTDEQRQTLREKVREMRSQDASREEIRTAIDEMLQEYGFDLPEKSESTSSEKTTAELNIQAQSYPNPFNPETQIAYTLSVSENVRIQIYNVAGQLIRSYDLGYQPAGTYSVSWDGRNESGDITASGVYLYRIEAGPYEATNSMVLLK